MTSLSASDRSDWLKTRQTGIGGSDVAAILGLSKWKTALDIYNEKVADTPIETEPNASIEWGVRLEPVIRQAYADKTGEAVARPDTTFRSEKHPFMIANIDGICQDGRILEIKTARTSADWGEEGTDEIPEYYRTQVQHYMTVLGAPKCDVAVLIGASDFRIYTVDNDPELGELLVAQEEAFWKLVKDRTPPSPRTLEEVRATFPVSEPKEACASEETEEAWYQLHEVRDQMAALKARESILMANIQVEMGDAERLVNTEGEILATWKTSAPRAQLDAAALKSKMPDIYAQYLKAGKPCRRFILKNLKEED